MIFNALKLYMVTPWMFLGSLIKRGEAQYIAEDLRLTPQSIKGWTREPNVDCTTGSGRRSPLQFLFLLFDYFNEVDGTHERTHKLARYISVRAGGTFIPLPDDDEQPDVEVLMGIRAILKETGEAIEITSEAWLENSPGKFSREEKQRAIAEHLEAVHAHVKMVKLIERL